MAKHAIVSSDPAPSGSAIPSKVNFRNPLPASVAIPGATFTGVETKYHLQSNHGGLHNIQADPDHPERIHAVMMSVPNVTEADTTTAAGYPNRNCFYVYSADGGANWTAPKKVSPTRAGFPSLALRKNAAGDWLPVIALHRYTTATSTDFVTALYMETGAVGSGTFVGMDADRHLADGSGSDGNIIWPSVVISKDGTKAYLVCAVSPPTGSSAYNVLHAGSFDLSDAGPTAWSGWSSGPDFGNGEGLSSGGEHVLAISGTGKLGLAWVAYSFNSLRGVYYESSSDGGKTWDANSQLNLWEPTDSASEVQNAGSTFMIANGLDLVFDGETPYVAFSAQDEELTANATYLPKSGTLGIWNPTMGAQILLSGVRANAYDLGSFLSDWTRPTTVDPQGANIQYPTLVHVGGNTWEIYFQTWANQDTELVNDTLSYPYTSIYRASSNSGNTPGPWAITPYLTNDPSGSGQKFDYRYPQVSAFVPASGPIATMVAIDTAAGQFGLSSNGLPGWDEMGFYYKADALPEKGVSGPSTVASMNATCYPNPFTSSTHLNFELTAPANVVLTVEDMLGRTIATVANGRYGSGSHTVSFEAGDLATGVYRYTLRANGGSISRSMSLVK